MKHYQKDDLNHLNQRYRANLINSISGYKSANLVGTVSSEKVTNLAIFSSVVHLGANPPLLGFIMRPVAEVPRNTYENIKETGFFTINHVHQDFVEKAHFTSAKFEKDVSEFEKCRLTEEYLEGFLPPFVKESKIKIGLKFVEEIPISLNQTILMIGEIQHLLVPQETISEDGKVDLNKVSDVCVSGLETYHRVEKLATFPYAKTSNLPNFE